MVIKKLSIKNLKRFDSSILEFNDDINILVGDNESGKSTVLEAIELCTNFQYRGRALTQELTTDLFNKGCVDQYLTSPKAQTDLPEILIEAYVDGCPDHKGTNNSLREDTEGFFVRIFFNEELALAYEEFVKDPDQVKTLPVEFYTVEWFSFAWTRLSPFNKQFKALFIDPTRLHPTFGRARYINNILESALAQPERSKLNLNFRQLKATFDEQEEVVAINNGLDADDEISGKNLKITADITSSASWESNLQLTADDIAFNHIGQGEQAQIQIKLALANKGNGVDILMVEEPENHLSHINLVQLVEFLESKNEEQQVFLTTHSSYVLNKLSINKLCLLGDGYVRLNCIEASTVKTIKRLPGYDTLRVVLAKKVVLVEGPSDELLIKRAFLEKYGCLPEARGIDVIVVRGIGFKHYLNVAKHLGNVCHVVKDNDGDYTKIIENWIADYAEYDFIRCFSPTDNEQRSLEPALIRTNADDDAVLDSFAKTALSTQVYNNFETCGNLNAKITFLEDWFRGEGGSSKKVDSAIRIFDAQDSIKIPAYLQEAVTFD